MGSSEGQTYCLRWNNHKSNLVEILDALIKMECYVDCTIVVDEQVQFKAHRVVLAANSPYFQAILQDIPMDHCSILFPGVKEFEMRALLEYMYTGEVNVTQGQIKRIMEIAEQLEVKGLYDMTDLKNKFESSKLEEQQQTPNPPPFPSLHHNNNRAVKPENADANSPVISTSNNVTSAAQSSSSPPYNTFKPYSNLYSRSPVHSAERPLWHISALDSPVSSHAGLLSRGVYDSVPDNNPLKRKKSLSINSMISDTPILRDRLAQSNAADSSQPLPLMPPTAAERREERGSTHSNGTEYSEKKMRIDKPDSPFTDRSFEDESMEQSNSFASDSRIASYVPQQNQKPEWKRYKQYTRSDILAAIECVKNGMSALQASRKFGVPSRTLYDKVKKMGITTGRPMNRTIRRSPSNGSSNPAPFPYGLSGTSHPYPDLPPQSHHLEDERSREREMRQLPPTMAPHALLGPNFLQQALDSPMHAMVLAAAAHSRANGLSTSPNNARSPSPNPLMRYMRPPSNELLAKEQHLREQEELEQELREREHEREIVRREREMSLRRQEEELQQQQQRGNGNEHEEVEDLSMARKGPIKLERPPSAERSPSPRPPSQPSHVRGVIVPPLSQVIQRLKEGRFDTSPPMPEFSENREITSKEPLESNQ